MLDRFYFWRREAPQKVVPDRILTLTVLGVIALDKEFGLINLMPEGFEVG